MANAEATVEELVSKIERGELCLPKMQRQQLIAERLNDFLGSGQEA